MHVVLVCKSGGDYGPSSVARLRKQIPADLPIICLTDFPANSPGFEGVDVRPFKNNWPGWWSKVELFGDDLFWLDCLYLDLDVCVIGDLTTLKRDSFAMWVDPYGHGFNSSVMWLPRGEELKHLHRDFVKEPHKWMQQFCVGNGMPWGDQAYIQHQQKCRASFKNPEVVSWKAECQEAVPSDSVVLVFHGDPKPYDVGFE